MNIDKTTMLFTNMTDVEAAEVMATAESIVLGTRVNDLPQHAYDWLMVMAPTAITEGLFATQRHLIANAYPQYALLSVARHYANKKPLVTRWLVTRMDGQRVASTDGLDEALDAIAEYSGVPRDDTGWHYYTDNVVKARGVRHERGGYYLIYECIVDR